MKQKKLFVIFLLTFLALLPLVLATSNLPKALLVAEEYNKQQAELFLKNISFIIAFVAGMITILSPCILPLLPAYFAVTFKEKRRVTLYTFIFFLGFALIFISMGIAASYFGKSITDLFGNMPWLIWIAGGIFILLGIMTFLGKGFSGILLKNKSENDSIGVFLSGLVFAVGWSACIGPILAGVVLMASTFGNYFTAAYLMFFYSLGIFVPLFILSFFYDKIPLKSISRMNKPVRVFNVSTTILNVIAAAMFILLGLTFIFFKGTSIINGFQMFGLKQYFYDWQRMMIASPEILSSLKIFGWAFLGIFTLFLMYFLVKEIKKKDKKPDISGGAYE